MGMVLIPLTEHKGISTNVSLFDLFFYGEMRTMGLRDEGPDELPARGEREREGVANPPEGTYRSISVADLAHAERLPILLTAEEAAEVLRVSVRTAVRMCSVGELPAVQVGRNWRVRTSDLLGMFGIATESADDARAGGVGVEPESATEDAESHLVPRRRKADDGADDGRGQGEGFQIDLDKVLGISL